jgi:hypothetical protein
MNEWKFPKRTAPSFVPCRAHRDKQEMQARTRNDPLSGGF